MVSYHYKGGHLKGSFQKNVSQFTRRIGQNALVGFVRSAEANVVDAVDRLSYLYVDLDAMQRAAVRLEPRALAYYARHVRVFDVVVARSCVACPEQVVDERLETTVCCPSFQIGVAQCQIGVEIVGPIGVE